MSNPHPDAGRAASASVPFFTAFWFWLKLGFISFGGPAGQIAIMHKELVEQRRWVSEKRFLHALNYCMLLPGPEAQQLATYLGWLLHRTWGGVAAGVLFLLPSLVLLIGLGWVYLAFGDVPWVAALFYGIKPAVAAVVFQATVRIAGRALKNAALMWIAGLAFVALAVFNLPFPLIVLSAALAGFVGGKKRPDLFALGGSHTASGQQGQGPDTYVIDDHTPTPPHAQFRKARLVALLCAGALLWVLPMMALVAVWGWGHTYSQMAWFFTKTALLTFGGAYAVLPYVVQGAVENYGWLTPLQMIDGLALGESTPGPLIMVVAFVAFVGGYGQALLGGESQFLAGALAAVIVTWFTFLPSFLFILAGGPLVEATHGKLGFTAPLTGITAAVVGVIANLALFFTVHIVWPTGFSGPVDWLAAGMGLLALGLLMGLKWGVISVLALMAGLGLAAQLFGLLA